MPKNLNYPLASFTKAYSLAEAVDALGGSCTVQECAEKMQRKVSGGFMVIISSAQKFTLVTFEKGIIVINEEYKLIKHSYTNTERLDLLRKAFLSPQVFHSIYERFKGQELSFNRVEKILIREFDVEEITAGRVAGYFLDGLKAQGLFNGTLLIEDTEGDAGSNQENSDTNTELETSLPAPENVPEIKNNHTDTSSTAQQYVMELSGPGIQIKLQIDSEEDLIISEAVMNKIKLKLNNSK